MEDEKTYSFKKKGTNIYRTGTMYYLYYLDENTRNLVLFVPFYRCGN